jgi:dCMP deaminase
MEDKHNIYLNIAEEISKFSKCIQLKVGAIAVKDGRIISTGYNGTPKKFKNCNQYFDGKTPTREEHHAFSEKYEIHAEQNMILFASKAENSLENCDIYVTHQPCSTCLKLLSNAGINNIYYRYKYDKSDYTKETYEMLDICKINLIQVGRDEF